MYKILFALLFLLGLLSVMPTAFATPLDCARALSGLHFRVAVWTSGSPGNVDSLQRHLRKLAPLISVEALNSAQIIAGGLDAFDALIAPATPAQAYTEGFGSAGHQAVLEHVQKGGVFVATGRAAAFATSFDFGPPLAPGIGSVMGGGRGQVLIEFTHPGKDLVEVPSMVMNYTAGPRLFIPTRSSAEVLGRFQTFTPEGPNAAVNLTRHFPKNGEVAAARTRLGQGSVIVISSMPETSLKGWSGTEAFLINALFHELMRVHEIRMRARRQPLQPRRFAVIDWEGNSHWTQALQEVTNFPSAQSLREHVETHGSSPRRVVLELADGTAIFQYLLASGQHTAPTFEPREFSLEENLGKFFLMIKGDPQKQEIHALNLSSMQFEDALRGSTPKEEKFVFFLRLPPGGVLKVESYKATDKSPGALTVQLLLPPHDSTLANVPLGLDITPDRIHYP